MRTSQRIRKILQVKSLDEWTRNFCDSLLQQVRKGRRLSQRQLEILTTKELEFSDDRLQEENDWTVLWDKEKEEIFILCALYYQKTGYFSKVAGNVSLEGKLREGYIPPKRIYNKMCNNKYAMKIRDAWFSAPLYPVGSVVSLRANSPRYSEGVLMPRHNSGVTVPYFILEANCEYPTSSCKGAKKYKLLAAGSAMPVKCEERWIKKMRRSKKK